jgi:hypothetical protein
LSVSDMSHSVALLSFWLWFPPSFSRLLFTCNVARSIRGCMAINWNGITKGFRLGRRLYFLFFFVFGRWPTTRRTTLLQTNEGYYWVVGRSGSHMVKSEYFCCCCLLFVWLLLMFNMFSIFLSFPVTLISPKKNSEQKIEFLFSLPFFFFFLLRVQDLCNTSLASSREKSIFRATSLRRTTKTTRPVWSFSTRTVPVSLFTRKFHPFLFFPPTFRVC